MANDWTRLLQETSKRGGPDGLKAFYENRGKLEGAGAMLLLAAGVGLLVKARRSFAQAKTVSTEPSKEESVPSQDDAAKPGDQTPAAKEGQRSS
jgi:hypothetical protein